MSGYESFRGEIKSDGNDTKETETDQLDCNADLANSLSLVGFALDSCSRISERNRCQNDCSDELHA